MKKPFKIAIATVLILLVGTAGVLYYFLNVKEYDVADEKVDEITKTEYKVALPDLDGLVEGTDEDKSEADGKSVADSDSSSEAKVTAGSVSGSEIDTAAGTETGGDTEDGTASPSNTDAKDSSNKKDTASSKPSSKVTEGKKKEDSAENDEKADEESKEEQKTEKPSKPVITSDMIKTAYRPSFEELQAQANSKIDSLVSAAYSEYSTKKQNGESVSITYFYRKYTSAGKELEASTDATFNYIYDSLVSDLKTRGFSASEANEFKTQYENAKAARENALIDKARSAM